MAQVLPAHENEGWDKRVESVWFPCADEGSTPSNSTLKNTTFVSKKTTTDFADDTDYSNKD